MDAKTRRDSKQDTRTAPSPVDDNAVSSTRPKWTDGSNLTTMMSDIQEQIELYQRHAINARVEQGPKIEEIRSQLALYRKRAGIDDDGIESLLTRARSVAHSIRCN